MLTGSFYVLITAQCLRGTVTRQRGARVRVNLIVFNEKTVNLTITCSKLMDNRGRQTVLSLKYKRLTNVGQAS